MTYRLEEPSLNVVFVSVAVVSLIVRAPEVEFRKVTFSKRALVLTMRFPQPINRQLATTIMTWSCRLNVVSVFSVLLVQFITATFSGDFVAFCKHREINVVCALASEIHSTRIASNEAVIILSIQKNSLAAYLWRTIGLTL
jgi:hypothetical protein